MFRLAALTLITGIFMTTFTVAPISAEPNIQEIKTERGLTAWLVESNSIPMVSFEIAFRSGTAFEPQNKPGLASFTANLLDEGTTSLSDRDFKANLERIGARFGAGADKLNLTLTLDTLTEHTNAAVALLADALKNPAFTDVAADRVRAMTLAALKRQKEDPGSIARNAFTEALYGNHPYATPLLGTEESVPALTPTDARAYHTAQFTKANMVIAVVGDITPKALAKLLDENFGDLPQGTERNTVAAAPTDPKPEKISITRPIPQSTVILGHLGISREHPDYFKVFVMNHILGGGGFSSRLMSEIREKRGLTYGVSSGFGPLPQRGSFVAQLATKNADAQAAAELVKEEIKKLQATPVSDAEFADAMNYLTGSFPLRLDSNDKILGYLTVMQMEDLGADYLEDWTNKIKAVTKADVQATAKTHLKPDSFIQVIVGGEK